MIFLLTAVKGPAVALTHGMAENVGVAQPLVVMSRTGAETFTWKNVVDTARRVFCSLKLYPPSAAVFVEKRILELMSRPTFAPAAPIPDWIARPLIRTSFFLRFVTLAEIVAEPEPANARASTVPAGFGMPVPAP